MMKEEIWLKTEPPDGFKKKAQSNENAKNMTVLIKTEPTDIGPTSETPSYQNDDFEIHLDPTLTNRSETDNEKKRRAITLEQKLDIIKRYENNERTRDIMRSTGINESTLRTIRNNAEKIKSSCLSGTELVKCVGKTSRMRPKLLQETERLLGIWLEEQLKTPCQSHKKIPFKITLTEKALSIYEELKKMMHPSDIIPFTASNSWYKGFKKRYNLSNIRLLGDALGTSIFHKQRIFGATTNMEQTYGLPNSKELSDLEKITANRELIVEPIFGQANNFNDCTNQNSDSENFDIEYCKGTVNGDYIALNDIKFSKKCPTTISPQEKLDVQQCERKTQTCDIRISGLNESTLQEIRDQSEKIKNICPWFKTKKYKNAKTLATLEDKLKIWVENELKNNIEVSLSMIRDRFLLLYDDIRKSDSDILPFDININWLNDFINRHNLKNIKNDINVNNFEKQVTFKREIILDDDSSSFLEEELQNLQPKTILEKNKKQHFLDIISENVKRNDKTPRELNYGITVTALMNNVDKIKNAKDKPKIIEEMEKLLSSWLRDENININKFNFPKIQDKALLIYEDLKNTYDTVPFNASFAWLVDFKSRYNLNMRNNKKELNYNEVNKKILTGALNKFEDALKMLEKCDTNVERRENIVEGVKRILDPYFSLLNASESKRLKIQN